MSYLNEDENIIYNLESHTFIGFHGFLDPFKSWGKALQIHEQFTDISCHCHTKNCDHDTASTPQRKGYPESEAGKVIDYKYQMLMWITNGYHHMIIVELKHKISRCKTVV